MLIHRLRRRALVALALPAALAVTACGSADRSGDPASKGSAGNFPAARLSIMAPADPGGGWDETARALQKSARDAKLAAKGVEVYNVPGAGGTIGLSQLITKRSGDANQLMVMGLVMLGAIETNKSAVDVTKATPIAKLTEESEAIVVPAKSKYTSMKQLIADLKADPSKVSFAGGSAGGTDQLLVGLMAKAAGVDPRKTKYVAYSGGGEAKAAILSGSVDAGVSGVSEFADQVAAGTMRLLAVSSPGVTVDGKPAPTIKDQGLDVEITNWRGIVGPPGLSDAQQQQAVAWVTKLHDSRQWQQALKRFAWTDAFTAGADFQSFLDSERTRVKQVVTELGLNA
jgi:putative tricarboxylic transport membrane protein